jgi:hypothetical protein
MMIKSIISGIPGGRQVWRKDKRMREMSSTMRKKIAQREGGSMKF